MAWSSLRAPGCLEYSVHADLDDPDRYVLYERWADQAALDRHDGASSQSCIPDLAVREPGSACARHRSDQPKGTRGGDCRTARLRRR
jgi:hypothetical protein